MFISVRLDELNCLFKEWHVGVNSSVVIFGFYIFIIIYECYWLLFSECGEGGINKEDINDKYSTKMRNIEFNRR